MHLPCVPQGFTPLSKYCLWPSKCSILRVAQLGSRRRNSCASWLQLYLAQTTLIRHKFLVKWVHVNIKYHLNLQYTHAPIGLSQPEKHVCKVPYTAIRLFEDSTSSTCDKQRACTRTMKAASGHSRAQWSRPRMLHGRLARSWRLPCRHNTLQRRLQPPPHSQGSPGPRTSGRSVHTQLHASG